MSLSPSRLGGIFALGAGALLVATVPLLLLGRPDTPLPFSSDPVQVLPLLSRRALPYWVLHHTLVGLFLLLLLPLLWALYRHLRETAPAEATVAFVAGATALVSEALGRLWHTTLERQLALLLATTGPEGQALLLEVARSLDPYHRALHLGGYLIVVWALLTAITVVQRKALPLWAGPSAFLLVPALGPFPWAALPWLVPMGLFLWREREGRPPPRLSSRSRR